MSDIAKIIRSGDTQTVQLPAEFSFVGDAVRIRRDGAAVILEPIAGKRVGPQARVHPADPEVFAAVAAEWSSFPRLPDDLAEDILATVEEEIAQQERLDLDALFR